MKVTRKDYGSSDPILDIKMSYFDFLNLLTDSWLEAEGAGSVDHIFRQAFFNKLDYKMRNTPPTEVTPDA